MFNEDEYDSLRYLSIKKSLISGKIEPDNSLLSAIRAAKTKLSLRSIAFCLRYGANPNVYVSSKGFSNHVHIVGYIYVAHKDNHTLLNTLIPMMMIAGSNLTSPMFDENVGTIQTEREHLENKYTSVSEWLYSRGYLYANEWLEYGLDNSYPSKDTLKLVHLLMEDPTPSSSVKLDNEYIIMSLGDKLSKNIKGTGLMNRWENVDVKNSIIFLNIEALETLLKQGFKPTYPMVNNIILDIVLYKSLTLSASQSKNSKDPDIRSPKSQKELDNQIGEEELTRMLTLIVEYEVELDHHQINLLKGIDEKLFVKLSQAYQIPRWKKSCKSKGSTFPIDVQRDLIGADIDINDGTCKYLMSLSERDPKEVRAASIQRRGQQVTADLSQIDDYIKGSSSSLKIDNRGLMKGSAAEYSSIHEVHYHDENGENWVFTSDVYSDILSDGINPHTYKPIPRKIIEMIKFRQKMLEDIGVDRPVTISESLDKLWNNEDMKDPVNHDETYLLQLNNGGLVISESSLKILSSDIISNKLKEIGISNRINELSQRHARSTLIWILHWSHKNNDGMDRLIAGRLNIIRL
jgi:hypothetical protein